MFLWFAFVTGLGLSMDAVAASICSSTAARRVAWPQALKAALLFGLFQALMPAPGYAAGSAFGGWVQALDHWIAFTLLALVGAKMIYESRRGRSAGAGTLIPSGPGGCCCSPSRRA